MNSSTKFVLDMFKSNKKQLRVIIIVATIGAILTTATPYIYGKLFDLAIVSNTETNILLALITLWLILSLISTYISNKTGYFGEVLGSKMALEAEAEERKRFFNSLVGKIVPVVREAAEKSKRVSIVQGIIYSISFVAVLGSAIFFLRHGSITPGQFVMFFGYINLAFSPFRFFGSIYRRYKRA